ncbi:Acyl-CoA N-acyltransferase [Cordyceps militaris CM01]|uniref:Acyl-CoA N-acyltransferase n=1 Tax=Cordyceps militaris (strain CM01) TaxID=983644 RepID=G3J5W2_CORMM|nr:Acyl-CoA N-acyltransferase [Cordyceps militaris CM01]EGX96914.1 Acyl-CoA N-acyltransferase [Cordyceps militaris CM01]
MSKVEDAVAADAATLGAMQINAFDANQPEPLFVEPYAVTGWATFIQRAASSRSGPQARVGVIRDDSGAAKAACLLHIARDNDAAADLYGPWQESWGAPPPDMSKDRLDAFFGEMKAQHKAVMGHVPHICTFIFPKSRGGGGWLTAPMTDLEIIMTHSTARGRGYGMALLQWSNEMADGFGLPLYLDAGEDVVGLYTRVGYVRQPDELRTSKSLVPMVRAAVKA